MTSDTFERSFRLGNVLVELTADSRLEAIWNSFSLGWPQAEPLPESGTVEDGSIESESNSQISLDITLVEKVPLRPNIPPKYSNIPGGDYSASGSIEIFRSDTGISLYFSDGAVVSFPEINTWLGDKVKLSALLAVSHLSAGFFEDLFFTGLAAALRRRHHYLVHAFAVELVGQALLFVGPSGSGKTTAGLKLCLEKGSYLANDVVILTNNEGTIYAHPTPGFIGVTRETSAWMEKDYGLRSEEANLAGYIKSYQPAFKIIGAWAKAVPVGGLFFPQVGSSITSEVRAVHPAISLARLMENSVDRWDLNSIGAHTDLLTALSNQAANYDLLLGNIDEDLAQFLSEVIAHQSD